MLTKIKDKKLENLVYADKNGARILIEDIGRNVALRNGKDSFNLFIEESMVGYYFKDFRFSKATGSVIHFKKTRKQKKALVCL